jgi:hypothetical protein
MPISVRLPPRVEQKLADYCVSHKVTKSEAVKRALEELLGKSSASSSPYELGKDIFERNARAKSKDDFARHSKRLIRDLVRKKLK